MGKYSRKHKKSGLLVAIALLLLVAVGGTLAYILTNTDALENVFNPSKVSCAVVEDQFPDGAENGKVSVTQKTNVKIKNTGDTDAYIRVALVVTWKNEEGNVYAQAPVASDENNANDYSIVFADQSGWEQGSDGFYYYTESVHPCTHTDEEAHVGCMTEVLIQSVTQTEAQKENAPDGYFLSVEIVASAIQSEGMGATSAQYAWAKAVQ